MFIQDNTLNNFPKMYTCHDYCSTSTTMYELRAWAAKTEMLDMGLWGLERAWKSGIFTRKTLLFGNINKMETLVYIITSLLSQKKF